MNTINNLKKNIGVRTFSMVLILGLTLLCNSTALASFNIGSDIWVCNNKNGQTINTIYLHVWKNNGSYDSYLPMASKGSGLYQAVGSASQNIDGFKVQINGSDWDCSRKDAAVDAAHSCFYTNDCGWGVVPNQYGFKETQDTDDVWRVQIGYNGNNWQQHGNRAGYSGDANLGIVTTDIYIDSYYGWCYGDSHDLKLFRKIKYNDNAWPSDFTEEYSQHWDDSGEKKILSNCSYRIFQYSSSSAGNYQYQYYLRIDGNGFTQDAYKYCTNNGNNMWVKFTYPGFINQSSTSHAFGTVNQGSSSSDWSPTFNHYGTALSLSNCAITNNATPGSGSAVDYFTVKSISESGVTVAFTPKSTTPTGAVTAYLHITDAHSKKIKFTLTGTVAEGAIVTAGDAPISELGPTVTLSGYIKNAGCVGDVTQSYRPYGFYYLKKSGNTCAGVSGGASIEVNNGPKTTGDLFTAKITSGLEQNTEYYYKPYIKNADNGIITESEDCYEFKTLGPCVYPSGDVITYTIDASKSADPCSLTFPTFDMALEDLKSHNTNGAYDYWWDATNSMIKKHIVFQVVPSADGYGTKGNRLDLSDINKYNATTGAVPTKRFTIEPKEEGTKPVLWGLNLANSRWITVKSMDIKRDSPGVDDGIGHSCVLIGLNEATNDLPVGKMSNSGLEFIDCIIEGDNFCCIHGNGIDGLYMEDNNLKAQCTNSSNDTKNWGASIKFMNSKNIKLVRNNFKGAHSNNIFAQNTQYMLLMENVFWNDNNSGFTPGDNDNTPAIVRLVNYGASDDQHYIQNIGMYYNTMYLAESENTGKFDFLVFGGNKQGQDADYYDASTIEFKYNNCYSYSTHVTGKSTSPDPFIGLVTTSSTTVAYNNFWSKYDKSQEPEPETSCFAFGSNVKTPYVSLDPGDGMVCETAPNTPEGIIIKGTGMNIGAKITSDISGQGAEKIDSDRNYVTRPNGNTWTYGAYQTSTGTDVNKIIWHATTAYSTGVYHWDNRNNWYRETADGRLVLVNCTDRLSDDLEIIIPDKDDPKYGKIPGYPTIIPWDSPLRTGESTSIYGRYGAEAVFAGADGVKGTADKTKYADVIKIEYGGALLGVENLNNGTKRYTSVTTNLTVPRKEWILVGSVISSAVSGNFYKYHMPHVYMQQFTVDNEGNVSWNIPFTSLEETINPQSSFAVFAADQYGDYKLPAKTYYTREEKNPERAANAGSEPITFTQSGDFAYDHPDATNGAGYATIELKNGYNILNNAYPAVLNATALNTALTSLCGSGKYSIQMYDYENSAWRSYSLVSAANRYILPQSGFLIQNTSGSTKYLKLEPSLFAGDRSTMLKNASAEAGVIVKAVNTATSKGSVIGVFYDAFNEDKAFNASSTENAELYVIGDNNKKLSVFGIQDMQAIVPLGVRNKADHSISIKFNIESSTDMQSVILEDRSVDPVAKYDLLNGEMPVFTGIPSGDTNGRFFLNINYADDQEEPIIPTDVIDHDAESSTGSIEIYAIGRQLNVVVPDYDTIKSIEIIDLVGRTYSVKPSDTTHSISTINSIEGTYIVTVVSEKGSAKQKVMIK